MTSVAPGIYRSPNGTLYERPWIAGVRTWRKLASLTIRDASIERSARRADQARAKRGLADNPYSPPRRATVAAVLDFYSSHDCPRSDHRPREGAELEYQKRRLIPIRAYFGQREIDSVTLSDCRAYHAWRIRHVKRGVGHRSTDLELAAFSTAIRCAAYYGSETGVRFNPIGQDRPRFTNSEEVRHARDVQPANAEELHTLARYLFDSPESEVLGWLLLIQAFTGRRINELYHLRTDASHDQQPGYHDRRCLYFEQRRRHKGTSGFIQLHTALRRLLAAHDRWKRRRYPESPWYFPGRGDGTQPVDKGALTQALARASAILKLSHRTSHGLRSYFVNVLRSQQIPDYKIALMLGQKTAGQMIIDVYGEIRPEKLTWLAKGKRPAWEHLEPAIAVRKVIPMEQ
jgi:integrase